MYDIKVFLAELTELSERHGVYLLNCGCCTPAEDKDGNSIKELQHGYSFDFNTRKYVE